MPDYLVVFITAPSRETAEQISDMLVQKKLAACVNIVSPINSIYTWQGDTCNDEEVLLVVKTKMSLFDEKLVPAVLEMHPYDEPEIIGLPIVAGSKGYLNWIDDVTQ